MGGDCDVDAIPWDGTVKYGDGLPLPGGVMGNAKIEWHITSRYTAKTRRTVMTTPILSPHSGGKKKVNRMMNI